MKQAYLYIFLRQELLLDLIKFTHADGKMGEQFADRNTAYEMLEPARGSRHDNCYNLLEWGKEKKKKEKKEKS